MKIVVTGASGTVGRGLVPLLAAAWHNVFLIGRSTQKLNRKFTGLPAFNYEDLEAVIQNADAVVHLATINNNVEMEIEKRTELEMEMINKVSQVCESRGVNLFLISILS